MSLGRKLESLCECLSIATFHVSLGTEPNRPVWIYEQVKEKNSEHASVVDIGLYSPVRNEHNSIVQCI